MFHRIGGLLLATYFLAWMLPWGAWSGTDSSDTPRWVSKVLLASLLVLGSFGESKVIHGPKPSLRHLASALIIIWLSSAFGLIIAVGLLEIAKVPDGDAIQTGLMVITMMPVASATLAWVNLSHADRGLSIQVLVASSILAPVLSLLVVHSASILDSNLRNDGSWIALGWNRNAITFLIVWVLVPTAAGSLLCRLSGTTARSVADRISKHCSLPILLVLNYINASQCLPHIRWDEVAVLWVSASVLLYQVAVVIAFVVLNRWTIGLHKMQVAQQRSVALAALLKNTGAAMVLVSSVTADSSMILFPILLSTLTQHLLASRICLDANGEPSRQ